MVQKLENQKIIKRPYLFRRRGPVRGFRLWRPTLLRVGEKRLRRLLNCHNRGKKGWTNRQFQIPFRRTSWFHGQNFSHESNLFCRFFNGKKPCYRNITHKGRRAWQGGFPTNFFDMRVRVTIVSDFGSSFRVGRSGRAAPQRFWDLVRWVFWHVLKKNGKYWKIFTKVVFSTGITGGNVCPLRVRAHIPPGQLFRYSSISGKQVCCREVHLVQKAELKHTGPKKAESILSIRSLTTKKRRVPKGSPSVPTEFLDVLLFFYGGKANIFWTSFRPPGRSLSQMPPSAWIPKGGAWRTKSENSKKNWNWIVLTGKMHSTA